VARGGIVLVALVALVVVPGVLLGMGLGLLPGARRRARAESGDQRPQGDDYG
jgi:hypothetical protein